jgi:hypothetical protein
MTICGYPSKSFPARAPRSESGAVAQPLSLVSFPAIPPRFHERQAMTDAVDFGAGLIACTIRSIHPSATEYDHVFE